MNDRMPCAMIIDDDPNVRKILERLFSCYEWNSLAFIGPETALAAFRPGKFDLLLCDMDLGENRDGLTVALEISARDPFLRVALMSGDWRNEDRARSRSLRFIGKPFDVMTIYRLCDWAKKKSEKAHEL